MSTLIELLKNRYVWLVVVLFVGLNYVGNMDIADAVDREAHYCKMVKLNKETNGAQGWPDYNGTYNTCSNISE